MSGSLDAPPLLSMRGMEKRFGGVQALADGTLDVRAGEVHALLGENGAGKSTLVKILAGAHQPDAGELLWNGAPTAFSSLADAARLGIRIIHQHLNVIAHLSVAENITLGRERARLGVIDRADTDRRAREALGRLGVALDLRAPAGGLRVAERQLIEIARSLSEDVTLLVMDEPTASLGDREVERLFGVIRSLRDNGIAIVFISHKLDEVFAIADRVTVLRDGRTVGTVPIGETSPDGLVGMMVGRRLGHAIERRRGQPGPARLAVEDLATATGLSGVSFTLHAGEVLGVYGLLGSGRTELARAIFGADAIVSGRIRLDGHEVRPRSPEDARRLGIGFVPEERPQGAFPLRSVRENLTSASPDLIARRGWVRPGVERTLAEGMVRALRIRTPSTETPLVRLSGGNQQKAILGRWLVRDTPILILDDPTSGIDVGAKDEIYKLIADLTGRGRSVLISSSELPELLALSDRILVLREGQVAGILDGDRLTQADVLRLAVRGAVA